MFIVFECLLFSSALASPLFQRYGGEVIGQRLAEQLEEAYSNPSCVDCKALSVIPGEQCWVVYVDALVTAIESVKWVSACVI